MLDLEAAQIMYILVVLLFKFDIFHFNLLLRIDGSDQVQDSENLFLFLSKKGKVKKIKNSLWDVDEVALVSQTLTVLELSVFLRRLIFTEVLFPEHFVILVLFWSLVPNMIEGS